MTVRVLVVDDELRNPLPLCVSPLPFVVAKGSCMSKQIIGSATLRSSALLRHRHRPLR